MSLKDITITASINSIPTQSYGQKTYIASTDEQSFPIETIDGGNGGSMPNLLGQTSSIGLFVNITQSWTGSINTPAGLVNFLHEDQSEFINGEFSGSVLTVTTQSLNPGCWPILFANQPDISYSCYFYYDYYRPLDLDFTPLSNFFNSKTSPDNGQIYLYGDESGSLGTIKYIKINRVDKNGVDNTFSLQELTLIKILFSDAGTVTYNITSIAEYPTYYLYFVTSINTIQDSSADNNIIDYKVSASLLPSPPADIFSAQEIKPLINYTQINYNPNGFFSADTGIYTFFDTPNTFIYVTASVDVTDKDIELALYKNNIQYGNIVTSTGASTITYKSRVSGIVEGDILYLGLYNSSLSTVKYSNVQLHVSQAIYQPQNTTNQIILEPYLTEYFTNSDCDVLMNNATIEEYSNVFMEVSYNTGQFIPTNQQQLISGTAEPAPVKSYNYSYTPQISSRYLGSELSSAEYNTYTSASTNFTSSLGFQTSLYPGDRSYGQTSVIDVGTRFGLYFQFVQPLTPELPNRVLFKIQFMFDEDGNVYTPSLSDPYWGNFLYAFGKNSKVNVSFQNSELLTLDTLNLFSGPKTVYLPGAREYSILTTQSGSAFFTSGLTFTEITSSYTPSDYTLLKPATGWFNTGSLSPNILTASVNLSNLFISTSLSSSTYLVYQNNPNYGFTQYPDTITPLVVNTFDTVRFNNWYKGDYQGYTIMSSSYLPSSFSIYLDRSVDSTAIGWTGSLDCFTILTKKYIPENIILNINNISSVINSTGFILPEYPSQKLKTNLSEIIQNLGQKSLL